MRLEKFTYRARRIVDLAGDEARRLGHTSTDTVHLLLGMIREGQGIAGLALADHDIRADRIIKLYDSVCGQPDVTLDEVASRSLVESKWLEHHYAGTEHLLLAVCCCGESRAVRVLVQLGIHPVQLCHFAFDILGRHDNWDHWLEDHPDMAHGH
jgi:ATP-dependent Clp protease ATP-binding subunit ClpC